MGVTTPGDLELRKTIPIGASSVAAQGVLVMLQEQDSYCTMSLCVIYKVVIMCYIQCCQYVLYTKFSVNMLRVKLCL